MFYFPNVCVLTLLLFLQGELQNRRIKELYKRTNRHNAVGQMTQIEDICTVLRDMDEGVQQYYQQVEKSTLLSSEAIQSIKIGEPYMIGQTDRSENLIANVPLYVHKRHEDYAFKVSVIPTSMNDAYNI
jgi:hypothetical protein